MFPSLQNHPFAVEAFFESSLVLTFAVPKAALQDLVPQRLQLDTFEDKWAFVAVAMVQTKDLRPKGFPKIMGNNFFLIGYRVFVRYTNKAGRQLRGLYILKSETDRKKMTLLGNIFTHYRYTTTDIVQKQHLHFKEISSAQSDFKVVIDEAAGTVALPEDSPFADWKQARRFAGPLPFTFSCDAACNRVLIIEGVRQNWTPLPVTVTEQRFSFLDQLNIGKPVLANAFVIKNIPYSWKKGIIEVWQ